MGVQFAEEWGLKSASQERVMFQQRYVLFTNPGEVTRRGQEKLLLNMSLWRGLVFIAMVINAKNVTRLVKMFASLDSRLIVVFSN